jgi:hypothetical protein
MDSDLIFAAMFSPGIKMNNMIIKNTSIFKGSYHAGNPQSKKEKDIEDIRKRLPNKLQ